MKHMVVGFAICTDPRNVVLIRKKRPEWQNGLLNGVGGVIDQEEDPKHAMWREFWEETGSNLPLSQKRWEETVTLIGKFGVLHVFRVYITMEELRVVGTVTDEEVELHDYLLLPRYVIPDIRWMIHLSIEPEIRFPVVVSCEFDPSRIDRGSCRNGGE